MLTEPKFKTDYRTLQGLVYVAYFFWPQVRQHSWSTSKDVAYADIKVFLPAVMLILSPKWHKLNQNKLLPVSLAAFLPEVLLACLHHPGGLWSSATPPKLWTKLFFIGLKLGNSPLVDAHIHTHLQWLLNWKCILSLKYIHVKPYSSPIEKMQCLRVNWNNFFLKEQ